MKILEKLKNYIPTINHSIFILKNEKRKTSYKRLNLKLPWKENESPPPPWQKPPIKEPPFTLQE